ncbi:helix-turn-helix transcriptional regulator [Actinosynnema mirum]|uniref:Transcriptional regulator, XRE family n=1 Tax=Actinosynnema mirum (strain ATCC 29888 / DSM 43827 / JCM 3225 / NBRC 14064 / NCIMB 13271 / NRRL B-12336 / IMRU 3971 / 101) TaxID=446462 RepID=C6WLK0_ACTMD|nr:helix-turn-helix transcriptional regulator [Actinosynnema mirum]ACU38393.1 transcriptional regulator, XRE family [Actinosynnema mirum DSM 43827]
MAPSVGEVLRAARLRQRSSQAEFGKPAGLSRWALARIEQGGPVDLDTLRNLATCHRIPPALLGLATVPAGRTSGDEGDVDRRAFLTLTGGAMSAGLLTGVGDALIRLPAPPARNSPTTVAALLERGRALFDQGRHARLVQALPTLLSAAHDLVDGDRHGHRALSSCYQLATHTLDKVGAHEHSSRAADRAVTHARLSGSPTAQALAVRAQSIVLRHEGRAALAEQVTLDTLDGLQAIGPADPAGWTVYVQMLCSSAYTAAQAGDRPTALELLAEAEHAHRALPATAPPVAILGGSTPTTAQVRLYRVGVHWALGESGKALHTAHGLSPDQFPTPERRARLHIDLARAWSQHDRPGHAVAALLAAHRHAPAEVLDRPRITTLAHRVIARHPRGEQARALHTILQGDGPR